MEQGEASTQLHPLAQNLKDPLIWIDLEMTGLNIQKNHIIEIAVVVTDGNLETIIPGPNFVVQCSEEELTSMDEWCTRTHTASGLVKMVRESQISMEQAESEVLKFLKEVCGLQGFTCQLAGNSVHEDKKFIQKDMPRLYEFLHYRIVDVSTVKELCRRWMPDLPKFSKKECHRALDDIMESIGEMKHYKQLIFDKVK